MAFDSLPDSLKAGSRFPSVLAVNDMSLQFGGLFDIDGTWAPPHADHRAGRDADIDVRRGPSDDYYAYVLADVWTTAFGFRFNDERATRNHVHLVR